jgi:hypothetical protein
VNAQGVLVMLYPEGGGRLDVQIDRRGTMTGRITGGGCSYHMVWQKEGKGTCARRSHNARAPRP